MGVAPEASVCFMSSVMRVWSHCSGFWHTIGSPNREMTGSERDTWRKKNEEQRVVTSSGMGELVKIVWGTT